MQDGCSARLESLLIDGRQAGDGEQTAQDRVGVDISGADFDAQFGRLEAELVPSGLETIAGRTPRSKAAG